DGGLRQGYDFIGQPWPIDLFLLMIGLVTNSSVCPELPDVSATSPDNQGDREMASRMAHIDSEARLIARRRNGNVGDALHQLQCLEGAIVNKSVPLRCVWLGVIVFRF